MAETRKMKFEKVGKFSGPIKNGKYENWEADATIESDKGPVDVVVILGSKGMAEKFTAGEYNGFFAGKDDNGTWRVAVLAKDNPGLGAPPKDSHYSGGHGGGGHGGGGWGRNQYEGCVATGCGIVKSMIENGLMDGKKEIADSLLFFSKAAKRVLAILNEDDTDAAKHEAPPPPPPPPPPQEDEEDDMPF